MILMMCTDMMYIIFADLSSGIFHCHLVHGIPSNHMYDTTCTGRFRIHLSHDTSWLAEALSEEKGRLRIGISVSVPEEASSIFTNGAYYMKL